MPLLSPLYQAFFEHPKGLCGEHDLALPVAEINSLETRLSIITLGSILNTPPNTKRWTALIELEGFWLLNPSDVAYKTSHQVAQTLQEKSIRGSQHVARVWWQICRGITGRFDGSFRALLKTNDDDALVIQNYLHQSRTTFPVLSAPITSAYWLDFIHRIGKIQLKNWDKLQITLPAKTKKSAREFGWNGDRLHPAFALALRAWTSACHRLDGDSCGFQHCPRHIDD